MEAPPLWVWGVIVAAIVAAKLALRWYKLKRLATASKSLPSSR
jgi:hypothetical protein